MPQNDHTPEHISESDPPSEWSDMLRETPDAYFWATKYRTGGRARGYRDLGGRSRVDPEQVDDDDDGQDRATRAATSAWARASHHWSELESTGGRVCHYRLSLYDADGHELVTSEPYTQRQELDGEAAEEGTISDAWGTLGGSQVGYIQHLHATAKAKDQAVVALLERCASLLGSLPHAPVPPPSITPESMGRAAERVARYQAGAAMFDSLLRNAAPVVLTVVGDITGRRMPSSELVSELVLARELEALAAVMAGDREKARTLDVAPECALFWAWAGA